MAADRTQEKLRSLYRAEIGGETMARSLRTAAGVVFLLNVVFMPLDYLAFPEHFGVFITARLSLDAVIVGIFLGAGAKWPTGSAITFVLAIGAMLLTMIGADGGVASEYTTGLVLLFCGIPVLVPLSALQVGSTVAILFASLASMPLFLDGVESWRTFGLHTLFPLSGGIVAVGSAALLDGIRFTDFLRRIEIEEARDHLKEMDRQKSRFTANVHHELRTPLTLLLAPLEGMLGGDFGAVSELQSTYMKSMHTNGLRLLKLINNLLDLAKIESNQLEVKRREVSLQKLVEDTLSGARPLAERKGIALEIRGFGGLHDFCVDPDAIEKVLVNLVGNALKFTEAGGRIDVSAELDSNDDVHLVVADTGLGIPEDHLDRIFDRFAQVDSSGTRKHEGTGIGLSLVKELVGLHGGRVWAESGGIGCGAEMHVILPVGEPDWLGDEDVLSTTTGDELGLSDSLAAMEGEIDFEPEDRRSLSLAELERNVEREESASEGRASGASRPEDSDETARSIGSDSNEWLGADVPEILVVEDNNDMRKLLAYFLGREFRVRLARNGREGLESVRARRPDLILTDVMMPEMTGTELCRAIKEDPETSGIPVVLVTSKAERAMKIEGLELGADDYVAKPFHPRELMARVRSLMRVHRLQEEVVERNVELENSNRDLEQALSDLRETEVQLVQAERLAAVGELAAGVAHEINNPVNFAANALRALEVYVEDVRVVASHMAAMTEGGIEPRESKQVEAQLVELQKLCEEREIAEVADTLAELVGIANEGMQRTSRLVGDLRDFAAPGSEDGFQAVDVAQCLRTTLQLMRHTLSGSGVEVSIDIEASLPKVTGNAGAINQVLLNLLKNAAEAFETAGGSVSVVAAREGEGALVVKVKDDGPGMAPEVRERLFEPFFSTKGAGSGTGLGLSISRRIVTEHGGSIEVESSSGGGTTFSVHLPVEGTHDREIRSGS